MANDYRLKGTIMIFGLVLCFFTILYFVRLYFLKEGFNSSNIVAPINPSQILAVPGSSFNIQCPNSAIPTITYGTAGSGTDGDVNGNPGSIPQTGIPSSTPAPTSSSSPRNNCQNPYTETLKPTISQCQQYYPLSYNNPLPNNTMTPDSLNPRQQGSNINGST